MHESNPKILFFFYFVNLEIFFVSNQILCTIAFGSVFTAPSPCFFFSREGTCVFRFTHRRAAVFLFSLCITHCRSSPEASEWRPLPTHTGTLQNDERKWRKKSNAALLGAISFHTLSMYNARNRISFDVRSLALRRLFKTVARTETVRNY